MSDYSLKNLQKDLQLVTSSIPYERKLRILNKANTQKSTALVKKVLKRFDGSAVDGLVK